VGETSSVYRILEGKCLGKRPLGRSPIQESYQTCKALMISELTTSRNGEEGVIRNK
jgi:hypothetical protein